MSYEIQLALTGTFFGLLVAIALSFMVEFKLGNDVWESRSALEFSVTKKLVPRLMDHFFMLFVTAVVIKDEIRASDIAYPDGNTLKSLLLVFLLCFSWHFVLRYMLGNPGLGAITDLKASFLKWRISLLHSIVSFIACVVCMGSMAIILLLR